MRMRKPILSIVCLLVLTAITAYSQGLYWEQTATGSIMGKDHEMHSKGYLKPTKLKTVSDEDNRVTIIRSDKEVIYMVNTKDKTYSEITFKQVEAQLAKAGEQMKEMREKLKDMPPEQRKMMEGVMGGMVGEKEYQLKKTGEKKKVAGYSCEKVVMMDGDKEAAQFWITKEMGSMKEYAKDWSKLMDKVAQGPMAKMYRKLAELDGFAMEMKFMGINSTTTKLEKRSLGDDEFEVPAGFKKVEREDE